MGVDKSFKDGVINDINLIPQQATVHISKVILQRPNKKLACMQFLTKLLIILS